jgi:hypothetical protein
MDQRVFILYPARKGLAAVAIDADRVAKRGLEAFSYALVTRCLQDAKFATSNPEVTFMNRSVNMMTAPKLSYLPSMTDHLPQYDN